MSAATSRAKLGRESATIDDSPCSSAVTPNRAREYAFTSAIKVTSPPHYVNASLCRPFNTDGALQLAKRAVERHYAVVGVLEDLNTTLTVLEHYVPRFFRGATDVYYGKIK